MKRSMLACLATFSVTALVVSSLVVLQPPAHAAGRPVWRRCRVAQVKALLFDVFGTVVDWRSGVIRDVTMLAAEHGADIDAASFADRWRAAYRPAMNQVRTGELPWTNLDGLHRRTLDQLLAGTALDGLDEAGRAWLTTCWHRLDPWPDAVAGLQRLKERCIIAAFSNGNVALLVNMAKWGGLPWDFAFSAELFRHYKPDPQTYLGATELLGLAPAEVMLVARAQRRPHRRRRPGPGHGLRVPARRSRPEPPGQPGAGPAVRLRGRRLRRPGRPARRVGNGWPVSRGTPATRSFNPVLPTQEVPGQRCCGRPTGSC